HPASGRRGGAGDEAGDRLPAVCLDPAGRLDLGAAADFANHDDAVRVRIVVEEFDHVEVRGAVHRIAANPDRRALTNPLARELVHGLVGEGAGTRDDAHMPPLVDVPWRNADPAAAARILAGARADHAGAV